MVEAPWTEAQCAKLNEFQDCPWVHEFTCGTKQKHAPDASTKLVATPIGWACPSCDYRQSWAHSGMFDGAPPDPLAAFQATEPKSHPIRQLVEEGE